jgi:hypothetical protein
MLSLLDTFQNKNFETIEVTTLVMQISRISKKEAEVRQELLS